MNVNKKMAMFTSLSFSFFYAIAASAFSWAPISPDELKMTSEPKAPGASAIILELQVDRDDQENKVSIYERIKILGEEGRKYGDVEIPYEKGDESVRYIEARTIRSDGIIVDFDGKIFDKLIVKGKDERHQAKTFSLPQVQVGSIVEYRYVKYFPSYWLYDSKWVLSEELFIKHAKYSLLHNEYYTLSYSWLRGLPPGTAEPAKTNGRVQLETHDVPAFVAEDYMPPENYLKYHVDFVYDFRRIEKKTPAEFWQKLGKQLYSETEDFMDKRRVMEQVVSKLVDAGDAPEVKLKKIYAHVQGLRNLTYEKDKTEQEKKRDKVKDSTDVADVEKHGYGNAGELTYLYVALARAAGFQADIAYVSTRNRFFFEAAAMNSGQLASFLAVVTLDGKEIYIEPGVPFVPFALLPWHESNVSGIRLNKQGGTWVKVPATKANQASTIRTALLSLQDGSLTGTVTVTYSGLEAIYHRLEEMYDDAEAKKEYLKDEIKRVIPTGIDVSISNEPDWKGVDTPLTVEYKVKIPGWVSSAGKRLIMPIGMFGNDEKHTFENERRLYPIYFHYANETEDNIKVTLPAGWQVTSTPAPHDEDLGVVVFSSSVNVKNGEIDISRKLNVNGVFIADKYYLALRELYQNVRTNDEEQIVISPNATNTSPVKAGVKVH